MPTQDQIAWAAGLFEGEGCIGNTKVSNGTWRRQLSLTMTDLDVVERFHSVVLCGTVLPTKTKRADHHKQQYRWQIARHSEIVRVLKMFLPYLGRRRGDAAVLLILNDITKPGHVNKMKTHCLRGHPLSGDNLHVQKGGGRRCKTCARERERARRQRS